MFVDDLPRGPFALQARYILPVTSPPLRDGLISIDDGRIVTLGENASGHTPIDLGDVAILPGLVNAHTHLEFSSLETPLGERGMPFADWIRGVIAHRRQYTAEDWTSEHGAASSLGMEESVRGGVTAVGNIVSPIDGEMPDPCGDMTENVTAFREVIDLASDRVEAVTQQVEDWARRDASATLSQRGVSPHAPYTVHPHLLSNLCRLSAQHHCPVAMHLAESVEELELLSAHSGPFLELLRDLDAWDPSAIPRGIPILAYLEQLAEAHRALVIHGNFLGREEIEFLAQHADTTSVVYCPRTHDFFQHGNYPLAEMLAAGVQIALGTDSRASNPDLSLLEEMRFVARNHPDVSPEEVLSLGTLAGARALGIDRLSGSLEPGKLADLAVVGVASADTSNLVEDVLESAKVLATIVDGRIKFQRTTH